MLQLLRSRPHHDNLALEPLVQFAHLHRSLQEAIALPLQLFLLGEDGSLDGAVVLLLVDLVEFLLGFEQVVLVHLQLCCLNNLDLPPDFDIEVL